MSKLCTKLLKAIFTCIGDGGRPKTGRFYDLSEQLIGKRVEVIGFRSPISARSFM